MIKKLFFFLLIAGLYSMCQTPEVTPEDFETPDGYQLTLVANEPLIADPVDLAFDENGHTYVLEMPGYPYEDTESKVKRLIDENNDGIYDRAELFADQLELASSIMAYDNGLLVAAPPYLIHLKDSDDDGSADLRDTIMGGFSTGNLQHNYNGLTYGIDNWIYAANGGNSGAPYWWNDTTTVIDLKGDDFKFRIETKELQKVGRSSGGFEITFDNYGRMYETHNLEHISQLVFPSQYIEDEQLDPIHQLVNISDHEENGLSRIFPIGEQETRVNHPEQSGYFSGACGITFYGGNALGAKLENSIWVADVVLNLIHVDELKDESTHSTASRLYEGMDFIASRDRSFRPVNMEVGPQGNMYIIDMYREVIEHPEWIPDEIEKTLDLNAGKDKGRIYKISRPNNKNIKSNYNKFKNSLELVQLLQHPNQWQRTTAQRLIYDKLRNQEDALSLTSSLGAIINGQDPIATIHATHILASSGKLTETHISNLLNSTDEHILETCLSLPGKHFTTRESQHKVIEHLDHPNQRTRMYAGLCVSQFSSQTKESNKNLIIEKTMMGLSLPNDTYNYSAVVLSARHIHQDLLTALLQRDDTEKLQSLISTLTKLNLNKEQLPITINNIAASQLDTKVKASLINQLAESISKNYNSSKLMYSLEEIEKSNETFLLSSTANIRNKVGLPLSQIYIQKSKEAMQKLADSKIEKNPKLEFVRFISPLPFNQKKKTLNTLLNNSESLDIQEEVLIQLWTSDHPDIGQLLVDKWTNLGPKARKTASDILLYKEAYHDELLTALETKEINIGEMNFDLERRRTLLWWTDNESTKRRAEQLFSDAGVVNRKEAIDQMSGCLDMTGSIENGASVFQTLCGECHVYSDLGKHVGPTLTEISRKSKETLLHEILDPNAAVDTKYINHRAKLKNGQVHVGIVESESDVSITIKKMGGTEITIDKTELSELQSLGSSMMPEGLEGNMSLQDMADLLTFLQNS